MLFRRLPVFMGGFDLDAAQAVAGDHEVERYQVLDQLSLLVDKSLVVAENADGRTRYRLLETVRQYALEKLGESGEADQVADRHRDHYTAMAERLDAPAGTSYEQLASRRQKSRSTTCVRRSPGAAKTTTSRTRWNSPPRFSLCGSREGASPRGSHGWMPREPRISSSSRDTGPGYRRQGRVEFMGGRR